MESRQRSIRRPDEVAGILIIVCHARLGGDAIWRWLYDRRGQGSRPVRGRFLPERANKEVARGEQVNTEQAEEEYTHQAEQPTDEVPTQSQREQRQQKDNEDEKMHG